MCQMWFQGIPNKMLHNTTTRRTHNLQLIICSRIAYLLVVMRWAIHRAGAKDADERKFYHVSHTRSWISICLLGTLTLHRHTIFLSSTKRKTMKFLFPLFSWICCLSTVDGRRHGNKKSKKCKVPKAPLQGKPLVLTLSCESDAKTVLNTLVSELTQHMDAMIPPMLFTTERVVDLSSDAQAYQVAADGSYANYTFPERTTSADLFVFAETELQVQAAVLYAQTCDYAITVRSGGHSYLGMSASCYNAAMDDDAKACMVIDVGLMKQQVRKEEDGTLVLGPGIRLEQVAQFLDDQSALDPDQNLFIPTGVCVGVALGGHVQTGGFGLWGRQLGPLASRVLGFRIVLSNGAIQEVVKPDGDTSQLNNDLYYAVLGGASGSWGVVTEINIQPAVGLKSVFWQTTMVWEVEGIAKML